MPTLLNGKRSEKAKSKMIAEERPVVEQATQATAEKSQDESETEKSKKFTLLRKLEPEMLLNPYPIEMSGIADSEEFCLEKHSQLILQPLGKAIPSEKDWIDFCRATYQWRAQAEDRQLEMTADNEIARLQEDPRVLELVRQKLVKGA